MEYMHSFAVRLSVTGNYLTDMGPILSLMGKYSCVGIFTRCMVYRNMKFNASVVA